MRHADDHSGQRIDPCVGFFSSIFENFVADEHDLAALTAGGEGGWLRPLVWAKDEARRLADQGADTHCEDALEFLQTGAKQNETAASPAEGVKLQAFGYGGFDVG